MDDCDGILLVSAEDYNEKNFYSTSRNKEISQTKLMEKLEKTNNSYKIFFQDVNKNFKLEHFIVESMSNSRNNQSSDKNTCSDITICTTNYPHLSPEIREKLLCLGFDEFLIRSFEIVQSSQTKVEKPPPSFKDSLWQIQQIIALVDRNVKDKSESSSSNREQGCIICYSDFVSVTLLPCAHSCTCKNCAIQLRRCPICRIPFRSIQKYEQPLS